MSTRQICEHAQSAKCKGCVKDPNLEKGGLMWVLFDRSGPLYHAIYTQRTAREHINSQAQALGIERPKVRNGRSIKNLNTLIYPERLLLPAFPLRVLPNGEV